MQVSLASLLTLLTATQPGNLGVFRWKTGLGTSLDLCKPALGGREGGMLAPQASDAGPTYVNTLHFRRRSSSS